MEAPAGAGAEAAALPRKLRAAAERAVQQWSLHEEKFRCLEEAEAAELTEEIPAFSSSADGAAEVECSADMLEIQDIRTGPSVDEAGRRVYLCYVGMVDDEAVWHDLVPWEVPAASIPWVTLAAFHWVSSEEAVDGVQTIPDDCKPSHSERIQAGVPPSDMPSCKGSQRRACGEIASLFSSTTVPDSPPALTAFYEHVGTADSSGQVLGVMLGSHEILGKGILAELADPAGELLFVTRINIQCTDAILDGVETAVSGFKCICICDALRCPFDSAAKYDDFLEWHCMAESSVVAVGDEEEVLAGQIKRCCCVLPPAFWDDSLPDLDRCFQL